MLDRNDYNNLLKSCEAPNKKGGVLIGNDLNDKGMFAKFEWYGACVIILMRTNPDTNRVNLTETYKYMQQNKSNKRFFSKRQWGYFIKKLVELEILTEIETTNFGGKIGTLQIGLVSSRFYGGEVDE